MAFPSFSKHPKLSKTDHFFILGLIIGLLSLRWYHWSLIPYNIPAYLPIGVYCLIFIGLELTYVKGKAYQNGIAHFPKEIRNKEISVSRQPKLSKTYKKIINFKIYITKRNNHNMFVAGRSGSGKSTLMRYMINLFPQSTKTIFSFKAGDEYLKLGIPILRISENAGDPFFDKEAFVQAFLVTYTVTNQGVVAASVPNLLRTAVKDSNSWNELKENLDKSMKKERTGSITLSAYSYIKQKLADLELSNTSGSMDPDKNVVLDFSGLNESAKSFYAELYLRKTWTAIEASKPNPMQHIVIIDEAHRLLKSEATIFGEVARLIRSRGALWCGTQNYTDLPDYVRNQFSIHLLFSTKSDKDLKALKEINVLLPFVATELPDHHFTDAAMQELHDAVPIFTADIGKFKDYEETYIESVVSETREVKPKEMLDYKESVLKLLTEEASWPSKLAKDIAKQEGMEEEPKLAISKALKTLQNDGRIGRQTMKLDDKEVMLYYRKDPSMSGLHKFMEREVTKKLDEKGIAYELANQGEDKPDIITSEFDIEIETGLKHDIRKLANLTKKTYVVVPSEAEIEKYAKITNALVMAMPFRVNLELKNT